MQEFSFGAGGRTDLQRMHDLSDCPSNSQNLLQEPAWLRVYIYFGRKFNPCPKNSAKIRNSPCCGPWTSALFRHETDKKSAVVVEMKRQGDQQKEVHSSALIQGS